MSFYGLASRYLHELIDFYPSLEEAARALRDAVRDEPEWRDELCVVAVVLPDAEAAITISLNY